MSAALADADTQAIAPHGFGHELLTEWAPFARDDNEGRASWGSEERTSPGHHGTPPDRWYVVNRIVSRLLAAEREYKDVVKPYYLGERPAWEIARSLGRTEIGVLATLWHVCSLVEREYSDWRTPLR